MDIQRKISEAQEMLDPVQLGPCRQTYRECPTGRHLFGSYNLYPAGMFRDRLLSAGKSATCYGNIEAQVCTALVSDSDRVAIVISYSGLAPNLKEILPILGSRHVPVIVIGTPCCSAFTPTLPPTRR